jgi:CDP-diacylglycerol--serine O-phosphatidyltransferase
VKAVWTALYLSLPLVISGILHMVVVRADLLPALKRPIHEKAFGPNKTIRGFVAMPVLTLIGVYAAVQLEPVLGDALLVSFRQTSLVVLGLALGFAYALAELPNSYVKRRLGISAGKLPEKNRFLFALVDQADSAIGCAIAYAVLLPVPWVVLGIVIVIGPAVHAVVNVSLYLAGLRKQPL